MSTELTLAEQATNYSTMRHIERVRDLLNAMVINLLDRGRLHDQSKLVPPEVSAFTAHTNALAGLTYGSPEYNEQLKKVDLAPALSHHYANNRHHPQHWKNGIDDMDLLDLLEMLCDWKAASERHNDGNIKKSIEHNADRFHMAPQLTRIFENTATRYLN